MKYKVIRSLPELVFELERLKLTLHEVDIRDIRNKVYISKLEKRAEYYFFALEQPDFDKEKKQFVVKEVYVIIHPKLLLVYDPYNSRYIDQFFTEVEQNQYKNASPAMLLVGMLDFFSSQMYRSIPKFNKEVQELQESVLDESDDRDLITNIQRVKRNLITFNSILEPIKDLNESMGFLEHYTNSIKAKETLADYTDRISKVIKSIYNFEKQMGVLSDSNEAQMQRRTNHNLGILTIINAMLLLPPIVYDTWDLITHKKAELNDFVFIAIGIVFLIGLITVYLRRQKLV